MPHNINLPPTALGPPPSPPSLWDVASGKCTATLQGHTGKVTSVAISPDGKTVVSGSMDNTARCVWRLCTHTLPTCTTCLKAMQ